MKVVVAHGPDNNVRELRKMLHGAGAQCAAEDCVPWEDLAARLGQSEFDLVVVKAGDAVDWTIINEARSFTSAPLIAIGPNGTTEASAREVGVAEYVQQDRVQTGLNDVLQRMFDDGKIRCQHGQIISVVAPTAGNGGTFVSLNLAGQLAKLCKGDNAFVDVSSGSSKVALTLDAEPELSLEGVCGRLHRLDRNALLGTFHHDETGLYMLYGSPEKATDGFLNTDVVRKLTILSRMATSTTVLGVGNCLRQPQFDAIRLSDRVVMVVRPDVPSLNRAATTMEQLADFGIGTERMTVVVNFWGEPGLVSKSNIEETLQWEGAYYLAYDPGRVNRCVNEGVLLQRYYPRCRLSRQLGKLAKMLVRNTK